MPIARVGLLQTDPKTSSCELKVVSKLYGTLEFMSLYATLQGSDRHDRLFFPPHLNSMQKQSFR